MTKIARATVSLVAVCFVPVVAWAQTPEQKAAREAEVVRAKAALELIAVNAAFASAVNAGDASRIGELYEPNAVLMPPGAKAVRGREAIVAYWKGLIDSGKVTAEVSSMGAASDGALGYDAGAYSLEIAPAQGGPTRDIGKYLTVLKKGADGKWRLAFDIWNTSLPNE